MLLSAWAVALLLVLVLSASIAGYGALVASKFDSSPMAPVLGLGLFLTLSFLLGVLGGYTWLVQSAVVGLGLALAFKERRAILAGFKGEFAGAFPAFEKLWLVFPALYFLARFFSCGLPQQHSDPLYYHLSAPKLWAELGAIRLTAEHPSYAQATLWETIYGIPQLWLGTTGARNHVIAQICGQWLHMFWGQVLGVWVAAQLLWALSEKKPSRAASRRARRESWGLFLFLGWLCTTAPSFEWLGCLAKNDYILALFVLAGTCMALRTSSPQTPNHRAILGSGWLMGLSYATKVFGLWAAVSAPLLFLAAKEPQPGSKWRHWGTALAGYGAAFALGAAPVWLRNAWSTGGNPFFPMLDQVFGPGWISSWWNNHNLSFGGGPKLDLKMWAWLWERCLEKRLPKLLLLLGALASALELWRAPRRSREVLSWSGFLILQSALALVMLRPAADGRYGNFIVSLWAVFLASALTRQVLAFPKKQGWPIYGLLGLGLLVNSPVDVVAKIPRYYWFAPATRYVEQFHPVYDMQKWVNGKLDPKDRILFTCEKQQFYLDRSFETVVEMRKWEEILTPLRSPDELFAKAKGMGYRYVHICPQTGGYPEALRPYWKELLARKDRAVFASPGSLVWDLNSIN